MASIYLNEEGLYLHKKDNKAVIKRNAEVIKEIPIEKIECVVLFGSCYVSSPFISELLEREIPVTWLSHRGKFYGRLESTAGINIERQREQFRKGEDEHFCLELSKSFITGKIRNSRVVLRRYNRDLQKPQIEGILEELSRDCKKVEQSEHINQAMGYEGIATKAYYEGLSLLVSDSFRFSGRTKQPPRDPFNSLLSFGYTLLMYEIYTIIVNKGLHPYAAFMHKIRRGHPALASDLMEEWRPVIVDSMVMNIAQNDIYEPHYFQFDEAGEGGVYLDKSASKDFIKRFQTRIKGANNYLAYVDYPTTFRESIQFQVGSLVKAIEEDDPSIYRPVLIR